MSGTLIFAIISISLALVFYTIGVFSERKSKSLNKVHVVIFWIGLVFDTLGTLTMGRIASQNTTGESLTQNIHGVTGALAIALMLFHAIWATYVLYKNDARKKEAFHKFSVVVWGVWLIPYIIGMVIGMKS